MADDQTSDPSIGSLDDRREDDEEKQRIFQAELVTDDTVVDPISIEEQGKGDDPVEILGVPESELKEGLDKRAFDGTAMPSGEGEPREYDKGIRETYEGTDDDLYSEQEDAADQTSDELTSQDEASGTI